LFQALDGITVRGKHGVLVGIGGEFAVGRPAFELDAYRTQPDLDGAKIGGCFA